MVFNLFLLFKDEEKEAESDGNASDDEADPSDDLVEPNSSKLKPTLEEYVKKHVFSRSKFDVFVHTVVEYVINSRNEIKMTRAAVPQ